MADIAMQPDSGWQNFGNCRQQINISIGTKTGATAATCFPTKK